MKYSTLYDKIGFVLDDLAQLADDISVLNTFKVGQAKGIMFITLDVLNVFSTWYFLF